MDMLAQTTETPATERDTTTKVLDTTARHGSPATICSQTIANQSKKAFPRVRPEGRRSCCQLEAIQAPRPTEINSKPPPMEYSQQTSCGTPTDLRTQPILVLDHSTSQEATKLPKSTVSTLILKPQLTEPMQLLVSPPSLPQGVKIWS